MGDLYSPFKVAAVQAAPVFLNREKTIEKACALIRAAGREGAKVIVFPEAFVPGFPHWFDFRIARECKPLIKELFKNAIEIPSPAVDLLSAAARSADATVVIGVNERDPGTMGTMYNTLLYIGPDGQLLGKHRKLVPTWTERLVHDRGSSPMLDVYPTPIGPLGGLICGENTNSFYRTALLMQGERLHAASWPAFPSRVQQDAIEIRTRNHAYEGKLFVISATGVFTDEIRDLVCTKEQAAGLAGTGAFSAIIGPTGDYLAGPDTGGETIVYADIEPDVAIEEKIGQDITGHYNRFDLFRLEIRGGPTGTGLRAWGDSNALDDAERFSGNSPFLPPPVSDSVPATRSDLSEPRQAAQEPVAPTATNAR